MSQSKMLKIVYHIPTSIVKWYEYLIKNLSAQSMPTLSIVHYPLSANLIWLPETPC
jgi:hypothetical protein